MTKDVTNPTTPPPADQPSPDDFPHEPFLKVQADRLREDFTWLIENEGDKHSPEHVKGMLGLSFAEHMHVFLDGGNIPAYEAIFMMAELFVEFALWGVDGAPEPFHMMPDVSFFHAKNPDHKPFIMPEEEVDEIAKKAVKGEMVTVMTSEGLKGIPVINPEDAGTIADDIIDQFGVIGGGAEVLGLDSSDLEEALERHEGDMKAAMMDVMLGDMIDKVNRMKGIGGGGTDDTTNPDQE